MPLIQSALLLLSTPTTENVDHLITLITTAVGLVEQELSVAVRCPQIEASRNSPVLLFKEVQNFLGNLYVAAAAKAMQVDRLLMSVDVVVEGVCGYDPWTEWTGDALMFGQEDVKLAEDINRARKEKSLPELGLHPLDAERPSSGASTPIMTDAEPEQKYNVSSYEHVVLGGTFDHLHSGHKILLAMSAWLATESVTVGIISPDLLNSKRGAEWMEPIEVRTANVDKFLTTFKRGLKYDLPTIHDPYGPTKWDPKLQAIVGSRETFQGCVAVNEERKKADLSLVDIYIIDVISSSKANVADMKEKLSSTDFRLYLEKRKREALEHEKEEHEHGEHAVHAAS